jgi:Chaperone of endosialidase
VTQVNDLTSFNTDRFTNQNQKAQMKTITKIVHVGLALSTLGSFALLPQAQAVVPPPDGGYPGGNTAEGQNALLSLTTGSFNTAIGFVSLRSDTSGSYNTGVGAGALFANNGDQNTATGFAALLLNTTGTQNTATGNATLLSNTTGNNNTANGSRGLYNNTTGFDNTASGTGALLSNTIGAGNTAGGAGALWNNTTGNSNTASGRRALYSNTEGDGNTAIGFDALDSNTTGDFNIAFGDGAGSNLTTGNNNIHIGNIGVAGESNTIRFGQGGTQTRIFVAAIRGVTTGNADAINVVIDSNGQLGTMSSSRRFKKEIKPMDSASEVIHALNPVTFRYKNDAMGVPQFGLVAEEVAKVNPDLVVSDRDGEPYSVRYDQVNAMLLNEFLKEHRKNEEQEATIARQQKQIEALTAGLQKVSAQLQLSKSAPQTVLNCQ